MKDTDPQIHAFWKNDTTDGYGVMIGGQTRSGWEALLVKVRAIVAKDVDPREFVLGELKKLAANKEQENMMVFCVMVAIATENGWIPNDEYDGILMLTTLCE